MATLKINGQTRTVDVDPDMPLLWVLREQLKLTGTKFGCGIAQCGACTVHVDGAPVRSCSFSVASAEGADVTTIEAIVLGMIRTALVQVSPAFYQSQQRVNCAILAL